MMRHLAFSCALLSLLVGALACEPNYGDLGQLLDPSTAFDGAAETFMAGGGATTEMIIFGEQNEHNVGNIAYASMIENGDITLLTGEYRAPDADTMLASFDIIYRYEHEYELAASMRTGSTTTLLDVPIEYTGAVMTGTDEMTLETGDGLQVFTRVGKLLERIDPATPDGELLLGRLINYGILVSVARVVGFGSAGLTMYLGRTGEFQGLLGGRQEVTFAELLSPKATFTYLEFTDLTGFVFDGSYTSRTDISATGDMIGGFDFSIDGDPESPPVFSGTLFYDDVLINDGVPDEGFYRIVLDDGLTFEVSSVDFNHMDLRGLFP